jgi:S-formylglutathione hydrolase FrmB
LAIAAGGQPSADGARVSHFVIHSRFVHARLRETLVRPAGAATGRPLLVFLHGRGMGEDGMLSRAMFAALAAQGDRAPDIVFPDGGDHSYWHDRHGAAWGRYVMHEVIPAAVKRLGADPSRVAIGGISMGGFGAFDLARLHPHRFCAVGAHSPALWLTGGDTAPGAFDDAEDFARHDLIAHPPTYRAPVWMDVGSEDPFLAADTALARKLGVKLHVWPGVGHGGWSRHMAQYLRFYADACG